MFSAIDGTRRRPQLLSGHGSIPESLRLYQAQQATLKQNYRSRNRLRNQQLLLGFPRTSLDPLSLHKSALSNHALLTGGTGSGKTSLITNIFVQLIMQARIALTYGEQAHSIFFQDLKPDRSCFHILKYFCEFQPFKDFFLQPLRIRWVHLGKLNEPGFVYNPFSQMSFYRDLLPYQRAAFHVSSGNFDYAPIYAESWFADNIHEFIVRILALMPNISSFREIVKLSTMSNKELGALFRVDERDVQPMRHFLLMIAQQARIPQFQPSYQHPYGVSKEVLDNQVDMGDVLKESQLVYFAFNSTLEPKNSRIATTYALSSLIYAAQHLQGNKLPVFGVVDESHELAELTNMQSWLAKIRASGISLCLLSQSISQWPVEARSMLLNSTGLKVFFDAYDQETQDAIHTLSGDTFEMRESFGVTVTEGRNSQGGESSSVSESVTRTPAEVPRHKIAAMLDVSQHPDLAFIALNRHAPGSFTKLPSYATVFRRTFCVPRAIHKKLADQPFPAAPGTFIPSEYPELYRDSTFDDHADLDIDDALKPKKQLPKPSKNPMLGLDIDPTSLLDQYEANKKKPKKGDENSKPDDRDEDTGSDDGGLPPSK